jgi:hypothetical protein
MPYKFNPFTSNFDEVGTGGGGTPGQGVPIGGTIGQVLTKNSSTNYDTYWATPSGGGGSVGIDPVIASMIF